MAFTFDQVKKGYANLWDQAQIKPQFAAIATSTAKRVQALYSIFKEVEAATGVPWFMVGVILYRESDLNVNTYLGNGQSLHRVTTEVPAGRGPFDSFLAGAIDAIKLQGMYRLDVVWSIELILYWTEKLNGLGYFSHGINSPYLWSWTTLYTHGKFTSDHGFDPNFTDPQGGCVAILKALFEIDPALMPPRIAQQGKPPMTTAPTPAVPAQIDISSITKGLETVVGFLPLLTKIFPPLAPIAPFIPLIQGALKLIEELEASPHDPQSIADLIIKHLGNIGNDIQTIKGQMPPSPQQQTTTGG